MVIIMHMRILRIIHESCYQWYLNRVLLSTLLSLILSKYSAEYFRYYTGGDRRVNRKNLLPVLQALRYKNPKGSVWEVPPFYL